MPTTDRTLVYVHGGIGKPLAKGSLAPTLRDALETPSALDAVEAAVRALEDDPRLNAGYGSVLNSSGELELDAGIADGSTGRVGAVAGVRVQHPISLARKVLEHTPHVFLGWRGAMALASPEDLLLETTPDQQARWTRAHRAGNLDPAGYAYAETDTVGAVGLDPEGRLAAGSSTGGVFGKMPGRVGDTPIFGAGFYASERVAVVGTGIGELFIETLACLRVAQLVEGGREPQAACEEVIELLGARRRLAAALLALDDEGKVGAACRGGAISVEGVDGAVEPATFDEA